MADLVVVDGDQVIFMPAFGPATVVVQPGVITGSGLSVVLGMKACLQGDEKNVSVPGCTYIAGAFSIPGTGTLKIQALAPNQLAVLSTDNHKPLILKGGMFVAVFEVQSPAKQPPPGPGSPIPDPMPKYVGQGQFVSKNSLWTAT